ncbi:hypothetical protein D6D25_07529 [Aureobasidium pullulans]|nr:hypothetical protein D6D25_07529 [Aureobasidium pullulans]
MFHNLHITLLMVPGVAVKALFFSQQLLAWLSISSVMSRLATIPHFRFELPFLFQALHCFHQHVQLLLRTSGPKELIDYHRLISSLTTKQHPR